MCLRLTCKEERLTLKLFSMGYLVYGTLKICFPFKYTLLPDSELRNPVNVQSTFPTFVRGLTGVLGALWVPNVY